MIKTRIYPMQSWIAWLMASESAVLSGSSLFSVWQPGQGIMHKNANNP
ncbi:MAG: hypothetical protein IH592_06680 [Bacteroidales bacterium]|nr:hypothetical protein [Bacteroidales bacterium]